MPRYIDWGLLPFDDHIIGFSVLDLLPGYDYIFQNVSCIPHLLLGIHRYTGYIVVAALVFFVLRLYSNFAVPKRLRHIPHVPFWKMTRSVMRNEALSDVQRDLYLPVYTETGVAMRMSFGNWVIGVAHPNYARILMTCLDAFSKSKISPRTGDRMSNGHSIAFENQDAWRRHHKIMEPAFRRAMPVRLFGRLASRLFDHFKADGLHVLVDDYMRRFAFDAIGLAGFGLDFGSIDKVDSRWAKLYRAHWKGSVDPLYTLFPALESHFLWALLGRSKLYRKISELDELLLEVVKEKRRAIRNEEYERIEEDDDEGDLLTMMIEENGVDGEESLSDGELRDNLTPGCDTTASALTSMIYFLAVHRQCQQRARDEVVAVLGDEPEDVIPTIEQIKQFDYIDQVIKESLRLCPPTFVTLPLVATEDTAFGSHHVPKGAYVSLDIYAMHHSPRNWHDPERFDPERFAESGEYDRKVAEGEGYAWCPFGGGARLCLGMEFSLTEQRVVLAMLLRKYSWELPADSMHKHHIKFNPKLLMPMDVFVDFHLRY